MKKVDDRGRKLIYRSLTSLPVNSLYSNRLFVSINTCYYEEKNARIVLENWDFFLIYFPEKIELRSLKVQIRDSGGILKIKLEQRSVMCSHLFLELGRESVQQEKLRLSQSWP